MEKKTDLRIVKTKKRIKQVFLELIEKKELKKITVTEIARTAEINKGTFYLHYKDIYELYAEVLMEEINNCVDNISYFDEFFSDPEAFLFHFYYEFNDRKGAKADALIYGYENSDGSMFAELFCDALMRKIYEQKLIERNEENDIKLEYIFTNIFCFIRAKSSELKYPILSKFIVSDIRTAFPEAFE